MKAQLLLAMICSASTGYILRSLRPYFRVAFHSMKAYHLTKELEDRGLIPVTSQQLYEAAMRNAQLQNVIMETDPEQVH